MAILISDATAAPRAPRVLKESCQTRRLSNAPPIKVARRCKYNYSIFFYWIKCRRGRVTVFSHLAESSKMLLLFEWGENSNDSRQNGSCASDPLTFGNPRLDPQWTDPFNKVRGDNVRKELTQTLCLEFRCTCKLFMWDSQRHTKGSKHRILRTLNIRRLKITVHMKGSRIHTFKAHLKTSSCVPDKWDQFTGISWYKKCGTFGIRKVPLYDPMCAELPLTL